MSNLPQNGHTSVILRQAVTALLACDLLFALSLSPCLTQTALFLPALALRHRLCASPVPASFFSQTPPFDSALTLNKVGLRVLSGNGVQATDSNYGFYDCGQDDIVPDTITRAVAKQINVDQIKSLQFHGYHLGFGIAERLTVTDRTLILGFLTALRHATTYQEQSLNRGDTLEIHFKDSKRPTDVLRFFAGVPGDGFGDEFQRMLDTLARDQARKAWEEVHAVHSSVVAVTLEGNPPITEPATLETILTGLEHIDSRMFAYTAASVSCTTQLRLKDGKLLSYHFVLGRYSEDDISKPNTLLPGFKEFYLEFLKQRQLRNQRNRQPGNHALGE